VQSDQPRLIALVEYAIGTYPQDVTARYINSDAFRADMEGFSMQDIVSVTSVFVEPASSDTMS